MKPAAKVWQPLDRYPRGAVSFLRALAAPESDALAAWAAGGQADALWAAWLLGQGLAPLAFHRLRHAGLLASLPVEFVGPLREGFYRAAGDAELHSRELGEVLRLLTAAGLIPVAFKGGMLAHVVYPDPVCRPMGDLDLWLLESEVETAQRVLERAGYVQHERPDRPMAVLRQFIGEIQLVGRRAGSGLVELHTNIFVGEWLRNTTAIDASGIDARTHLANTLGYPVRHLAPEDALIQLAVHLAVNHQMAYPGVRALLDIVLLAQTEPIDWSVLAERARAWRVTAAVWLPLQLADAIFGLPGAAAALARLQPGQAKRWLLGRFANTHSLLAGRDLTHGPLRLVYQLVLVDRPRDAVRLLWRAFWPERAWLVARYGSAAPRVRIRHLLGAARGRM